MSYEFIRYEVSEGIATLTLNRSDVMNAMHRPMHTLQLHTITLTTGDLKTGMTASGMSVGLVHDIQTVGEVVERIMAEAYACQRTLNDQLGAGVSDAGNSRVA